MDAAILHDNISVLISLKEIGLTRLLAGFLGLINLPKSKICLHERTKSHHDSVNITPGTRFLAFKVLISLVRPP